MRFADLSIFSLVAFVLALTSAARADDPPSTFGMADLAVLQRCHDDNLHDLELAKLAMKQADKKVQKLAKRLHKDHLAADKQVLALAEHHGQVLADYPAPTSEADLARQTAHEELVARLAELRGGAFDAAYLEATIASHDEMHAFVTKAIGTVADDTTRALLEELAPTIAKHAQLARAHTNPPTET
jgi:predicted outer membrane protein